MGFVVEVTRPRAYDPLQYRTFLTSAFKDGTSQLRRPAEDSLVCGFPKMFANYGTLTEGKDSRGKCCMPRAC
jgi:hypothetical protein